MITIRTLNDMKTSGEKIVALTSYDASFAQVSEQAGVEILLVGDSLGMVIQGHESTLPVTVDDMVYHTANVSGAVSNAFILTDMPFMSYTHTDQAILNAGRLMKEGGAQMVKIEGGSPYLETVRYLAERAIPVCGHLGLMPQSVHQLGGYSVQGKDERSAAQIISDAKALEDAGAQMLVLECVPSSLAAIISRQLTIPVIGIGAGPDCDGQVLVSYDMLGITADQPPRFVKNFLQEASSIQEAITNYVTAVKTGGFPAKQHTFS